MLTSVRARLKKWLVVGVVAWMVAGNPALRRQVLGTASTVTRAVYQTVAQRLDHEAQQFDRERDAEERRLVALRTRLSGASSESERLALAREIRDGEARLTAAQADLGQIIRQAQVVVETGDGIGESWRVARGYSGATRDSLLAAVEQSQTERARMAEATKCQASELESLKQAHAVTSAELLAAAELLREARQRLTSEGCTKTDAGQAQASSGSGQ